MYCFQLTAVCFNNGTEVSADICIQGVGKVPLVITTNFSAN